MNTTRMQDTNVTFRLQHYVFLLLLSAVSSIPFAAAQTPPVGSVSTSLDLTLHVHTDSIPQKHTPTTSDSLDDSSDCLRRPGVKASAPGSTGAHTTTATHSVSDLLAPRPANNGCPASSPTTLDGVPQYTEGFTEKIHWKPILVQSLEFLLLEHGVRLASDRYAHYLTLHKPFWGDWIDSLHHFDMGRWGDGDDFLVNYIGHPLQGAVSGNVFIQNDPRGRAERFGKSSSYWKSRLRAMAWATAYSTYFEIGPILSEAAIGNEGGYTYVPQCGLAPCSKPGRHFNPPTNNTGWVDFVVTPTVGIGWIVLEDSIEEKIVNPLAGDNSMALKWRIVRGSLAPSRSLSNFLQGKAPWYRPWQYENPTGRNGSLRRQSEKPRKQPKLPLGEISHARPSAFTT